MIEPFGYVDILEQTAAIVSLIGLLLLFLIERSTYGRSSIGTESWPKVLLYNILTGGAYAIYWRIKVTYALSSRDRYSTLPWALILTAVFILYFSISKLFIFLSFWDLKIRSKLEDATKLEIGWFRTVIFGHLYLASEVERTVTRLPLDFRAPRPERRKKIIKVYGVCSALVLLLVGLSYVGLVEHRKSAFAAIPVESIDRTGYWHENSEKYETIYAIDNEGRRDIITRLHHDAKGNPPDTWLSYRLDTKFHDGYRYSFNWFSCISKERVVEMTSDLLLVKNAKDQSIIENRLTEEDFRAKQSGKSKSDQAIDTLGWEYGELLRSPWRCELAFIRDAWQHAYARAWLWLDLR